jgi:hypothetical protein
MRGETMRKYIILGIVITNLASQAVKAQDPILYLEEAELFRISAEMRQVQPELDRVQNYMQALKKLHRAQKRRVSAVKKEGINRESAYREAIAYYGQPARKMFNFNRDQAQTGARLVDDE